MALLKLATRYTFNVGLREGSPICTVEADSLEAAFDKAEEEMDRRYGEADMEPPVAWTFVLIKEEEL